MAVAFTSHGYDTTPSNPITENVWGFDFFPQIGSSTYGVRGAGDWKASGVAGQDRTVSVSSGRGWGHGVTDKTDANETLQLETIASGTRWDMIAVRRDWTPTAGVSKFQVIKGGATQTIPSGRLLGPSVDDQPIWLVQVTAGQTQITGLIDLRVWVGDGAGIVAGSDLVRSYMDAVGTRINADGIDWLRKQDGNGTPFWENQQTIEGVPAFRRPIIKAANVALNTTPLGDAYYTFPSAFPTAMVSCVASDATDPAQWGPMFFKFAAVYSDRTRFCFRLYDRLGNVVASKTNLNISFVAVGY